VISNIIAVTVPSFWNPKHMIFILESSAEWDCA
jgi:hypothetical protein